jgi:hypothetical protein
MKIETVGELKKLISDMPDDTPIVAYQSNMERSGYMQGMSAIRKKMPKSIAHTRDAFDYTPYSYEIFEESSIGNDTLCIL